MPALFSCGDVNIIAHALPKIYAFFVARRADSLLFSFSATLIFLPSQKRASDTRRRTSRRVRVDFGNVS